MMLTLGGNQCPSPNSFAHTKGALAKKTNDSFKKNNKSLDCMT